MRVSNDYHRIRRALRSIAVWMLIPESRAWPTDERGRSRTEWRVLVQQLTERVHVLATGGEG